MTARPKQRRGQAPTARLTAAVAAQLAELHARSTIKKGQSSGSVARRAASTQLWALVDEQYRAGVSSQELGAVLGGVQAKTVLAQLRHHGYLGGPSASQRLVREAAGPGQIQHVDRRRAALAGREDSHGQRSSPQLIAAADRVRQTRQQLATAKAQAAAAQEQLRHAVLAEHAASGSSPRVLSVQAGVAVNTVRRWLEADDADSAGPGDLGSGHDVDGSGVRASRIDSSRTAVSLLPAADLR